MDEGEEGDGVREAIGTVGRNSYILEKSITIKKTALVVSWDGQ